MNADKNQRETILSIAHLLLSSMQSESFIFALFRDQDDIYKKHCDVIRDQIKCIPFLHPDKI